MMIYSPLDSSGGRFGLTHATKRTLEFGLENTVIGEYRGKASTACYEIAALRVIEKNQKKTHHVMFCRS